MKIGLCCILMLFLTGCRFHNRHNDFTFQDPTSLRDKALDFIRQGKITIYICGDGTLLDCCPTLFEKDKIEETLQMIKDENAKKIQISDVELAGIEYFYYSMKENNQATVSFKVKGTYGEFDQNGTKRSYYEAICIVINRDGTFERDLTSTSISGPIDSNNSSNKENSQDSLKSP